MCSEITVGRRELYLFVRGQRQYQARRDFHLVTEKDNVKHLLITLTLAACAYSQTGSICYTPNKATPAKVICRDVPPEVTAAARAFVAAEVVSITPAKAGDPTTAPKFSGVADLLFGHDTGLFTALLDRFPPANVATAIAQRVTAEALIKTRQDAALAKPVSAADPI